MLARAALRTTRASSTICARYSIPSSRAVVRFASTIDSSAKPPPATPSAALASSTSTSTIANKDVEILKEAAPGRPSGDENATVDELVELEEGTNEALQRDATDGQVAGIEDGENQLAGIDLSQLTAEELEALFEQQTPLSGMTEEQLSATVIHGRSLIEPLYHPRTHGIPVAVVHLRSYYPNLLELFTSFSTHAASALGIPISRPTPLPIKRNLWTVIKSPFVHKKSQENFERKTYKRVIKAWDADYEVVNRWAMYLEKNALAGVGMRFVKWERAPVGVGSKVLEAVQDAIHPSEKPTNRDKIKALSDKIVKQELAATSGAPVIEQSPAKAGSKGPTKAQAADAAKAPKADAADVAKALKADTAKASQAKAAEPLKATKVADVAKASRTADAPKVAKAADTTKVTKPAASAATSAAKPPTDAASEKNGGKRP